MSLARIPQTGSRWHKHQQHRLQIPVYLSLGRFVPIWNGWLFCVWQSMVILYPPTLRSKHTNNVLEYMASIITICVEQLEGCIPSMACCLSLSDSTSTVGWMHRTSFDTITKPVQESCSQHIASIMMRCNITIYSQHRKGKHNNIADLLSRWYFRSDVELTTVFRSYFPSKSPGTFSIFPLPKEVTSWITGMLQILQTTTQSESKHTTIKQEHGNDGCHG